MKRSVLLGLAVVTVLSVQAGTYTENANTVKQTGDPSGANSCVTNHLHWTPQIAPNLNQAKTPSNPAAAGKEFFTPAGKTFRTLKDPPSDWGALKIEHPIHIAGTLQAASAFARQPMSFASLSLYDGSKIPLATTAGFKDSEVWIRSGSGSPCTLSGAGMTTYIQNCQFCGYNGSGLKVCQSGSNFLVVEVDDSFKRFNGSLLLAPGTDVGYDTKFRLTGDFNCPGEVIARQRGFFTVKSGVKSTINVRRLELKGGCLELNAGSYATFTNLVFTTQPYGSATKTTFAPESETRPVVTVLDSVSFAAAAKPYPIHCTYTKDDSVFKSYPLMRAKGTLDAADFKLASSPKANSILVTTSDVETGMTTLWIKEMVALTASDSGFDSSFTNGVRWSDAKVPHDDADYYVPDGMILRTQKDYVDGVMTFAGRSLWLAGVFQTTTRWTPTETVYLNAQTVIPELHAMNGSEWTLNCNASISNTTIVVEADAATPFKVNYNVKGSEGFIGLYDVTLKGGADKTIRFASSNSKTMTVAWNGAADEFSGLVDVSTNYVISITDDLASPGYFNIGANSRVRANGGTVTLGKVQLNPAASLVVVAKDVEGEEVPGKFVITRELARSDKSKPINVSVPLAKGVKTSVATDILTFPKPETPLTIADFAVDGPARRAHATFEVVTEGDVQKLRMTREPSGLAIIFR